MSVPLLITTLFKCSGSTLIDDRLACLCLEMVLVLEMVYIARPDFAEVDVFLGQHILLTLEQHCNPKILS